jgi:hypothetical protein
MTKKDQAAVILPRAFAKSDLKWELQQVWETLRKRFADAAPTIKKWIDQVEAVPVDCFDVNKEIDRLEQIQESSLADFPQVTTLYAAGLITG